MIKTRRNGATLFIEEGTNAQILFFISDAAAASVQRHLKNINTNSDHRDSGN
ncbi:hypothetical protein ACI0FM_08690 [Paenochrobactrum sp. BZR 588]|uniref:hypothetical protein n=1 Tax=Paenochrobactrum TaxID=999488 RepID=UPI0035BBA53D